MKNIINLLGFIALLAIIGFSMVTCSDDDGGGDEPVTGTSGLAYELNSDETYGVSKGTVTGGAVVIPSTYNGKPVTGIYNFTKTAITSITIPNNVAFIGLRAFQDCTSLISITIPESVKSIDEGTFSGCTSLSRVTIPAGVRSIGDYTFSSCTGLTSITIPASVTSIGSGVFVGCTSLTKITVDRENPNYTSEDGILYNKAKTTIITFPSASGIVTIPNSVTVIDFQAFSGCTSLTRVTISASVMHIGGWAFGGCTGLTSVTFAAGSAITSGDFRTSAFPVGPGSGGDNLKTAYLAGGAGTYTRASGGYIWTKQ